MKKPVWLLLVTLAALGPPMGRGDEGMWPLDHVPASQIRAHYGAKLGVGWLAHARRSALSVSGASGSFVSADGLFTTAEHVGLRLAQTLNTPQRDVVQDGFYASALGDELRCKGAEVKVLIGIEDVTDRVRAAEAQGRSAQTVRAAIEADVGQNGRTGEIVTLWQGARVYLYRYKRYDDVRLVFLPERRAAALRSSLDDPDPRGAFDVAFFRVCESGAPAKTPQFFRWSLAAPTAGSAAFIVGNPESSSRALTFPELKERRDVALPRTLGFLDGCEVVLTDRNEPGSRAERELRTVRGQRQDADVELGWLLDPAFMDRKAAEKGWEELEPAVTQLATLDRGRSVLRTVQTPSWYFEVAHALVRLPGERAKAASDRRPEFQEERRPLLEAALLGPAPRNTAYETAKLAYLLTWLARELGADSPAVRSALAGMSPSERAASLVRTTRLGDAGVRRALYANNGAEANGASDPLLDLVRAVDATGADGEADELRLAQMKQHLAEARLARASAWPAPDATGTLRLTYGAISGYQDGGRAYSAVSVFRDVLAPTSGTPLPPRWSAARPALAPEVPLDFATDCDIVGGNSGSATLNRDGELIGVMFGHVDRPIPREYLYSPESRTMSVSTLAVAQALEKIYHADRLLRELKAGGAAP